VGDSVEFLLPGGLVHTGTRRRRGRLRPITGQLEFSLAQVAADDRLAYIDQILATAATLDELELTPLLAAQLSEGDRQYLLLRLAAELSGRQRWLSATCRSCGVPLDLDLDLAEVPVSEAGVDYPRCRVDVGSHTLELRAPVSSDVAGLRDTDEVAAARALLLHCVLEIDGHPPTAAELDGLPIEVVERIDAALDELCPAVATRLTTCCPGCDAALELEFDPVEMLTEPGDALALLFEEVHVLASRYHWSEKQILALPRERRRLYLRFIDRDRGMTGEVLP
jgi:hypothetical protein